MSPGEIAARLDEHKAQLNRIERKVDKTNGRVTRLELWQARVEGAKGALSWVQPLVIALVTGGAVATFTSVLGH